MIKVASVEGDGGEPGVPSTRKEKESSIRSTTPEWRTPDEEDEKLYKSRRPGRSDFGFILCCWVCW